MPTKQTFFIEVRLDENFFTVEEIWPDGDEPENPTSDDVIASIRQEGSIDQFLSTWNVTPYLSVAVDGKVINWNKS